MFPSGRAVLRQDLARLERDCVQLRCGRGCIQPVSLPCSPRPRQLSAGSSTALGCSLPSFAGNVLLKCFFPKLGLMGWLAVFSIEVPRGWAVPDTLAAWPGGTPAPPCEPVMGRAAPP